ncbi:MAG: hypothetical protein LBE18_09090 [Planctomycetaceae bacterium]|jgi:hypothetical protein|nr:hypothetical protein [Planctomycetaceae bacterium]
MSYLKLSLVVVILLCFDNVRLWAKEHEIVLNSEIVKEIIRGHNKLEQATRNISGLIVRLKDNADETDSNTTKNNNQNDLRQYFFYKNSDLLRLEYIQPLENTWIAKGHKYNDITFILLRTKNFDYEYYAIPSKGDSGVSFANLIKSKIPNDRVGVNIRTDLLAVINILTALPGVKITEVLQRPIGKVEKRQYDNIPDALWLSGVEEITKSQKGTNEYANWQIILNPHQDYALMYHTIYGKDDSGKPFIQVEIKVTSQEIKKDFVVPKEIFNESYLNGKKSSERVTIDIHSTEEQDKNLFSEDSFKEVGRRYVLSEMSSTGKQNADKIIDVAPYYYRSYPESMMKVKSAEWSLLQIVLVAAVPFLLLLWILIRAYKRYQK